MYIQHTDTEGRCTHNKLVRREDVHTTDWYGEKMYIQHTDTEGRCTHNKLVRGEDVHTTNWYTIQLTNMYTHFYVHTCTQIFMYTHFFMYTQQPGKREHVHTTN